MAAGSVLPTLGKDVEDGAPNCAELRQLPQNVVVLASLSAGNSTGSSETSDILEGPMMALRGLRGVVSYRVRADGRDVAIGVEGPHPFRRAAIRPDFPLLKIRAMA